MAGKVEKGRISKVMKAKDWNNLPCKATINPSTNEGAVTPALTIPWHLRGRTGNIKVGDEVAYCLFDDGTGVILDRLDGEWKGEIDYPVTITGDVTNEKNVTTTGKTTTDDLTTSAVGSYNGHFHTYHHGDTSGPKG